MKQTRILVLMYIWMSRKTLLRLRLKLDLNSLDVRLAASHLSLFPLSLFPLSLSLEFRNLIIVVKTTKVEQE